MRQFRVWAPNATRMTLLAGSAEVPMGAGEGGWWVAEVDCGENDIDYGYCIDGGPVRPDPRSRRQPNGVHGLSRTYDPGAFRWSDSAWRGRELAGAVIYELHIGTFTPEGTLDSAIARLDHLAELGIDFVELLPVNSFNGMWNWGYDGVCWFAVHEPYGGPVAYQRFVDACHRLGLGVIQDVVYNHLGPSGNYLPEFGPYLRTDAANTWGASVNLDGPGSDDVRRYILDNARMWFADYRVDGLRLDAVHALRDSRALTLLEELAIETDALASELGRPRHLIAESDLNDPRLITPRVSGGLGLAAAWDDDVHHAIHVAVTGETSGYFADFAPLGALAKALRQGYFHDGTYSSFRGRSHGRPIDTAALPPWQLIASIQTHDQVGNRAAGDRLASQAGWAAQSVAAVLLLTAPFTPMLFMGEEWAASTPWPFFTSHPEADLAEATRIGRLTEFDRHGWDVSTVPDPQDPRTFGRAKLDWSEPAIGEHAAMLDVYRNLLRLRRSRPELAHAAWTDLTVEHSGRDRWLVMRRGGMSVAVNLATHRQPVPLGLPDGPSAESSGATFWASSGAPQVGLEVLASAAASRPNLLFATAAGVELRGDHRAAVLPPMSAAILG